MPCLDRLDSQDSRRINLGKSPAAQPRFPTQFLSPSSKNVMQMEALGGETVRNGDSDNVGTLRARFTRKVRVCGGGCIFKVRQVQSDLSICVKGVVWGNAGSAHA
jgi:hypothetical protein